ncbi:MAG: hypothetical protein JXA41_00940 [Deltaproteobacteria bacterium]|nr:hypothetical protein [Deltaproteobacteria bacterium]
MKKTCDSCGQEYHSGEDWIKCPHCGRVLCPRCTERESKKDVYIARFREGDPYTRLRLRCPSYSIEMM